MPIKHDTSDRNPKPSNYREILTADVVRELLDYDPETGLFTWKWRTLKWFPDEHQQKVWNTKFAGKRAFTSMGLGYYHGAILRRSVRANRVAFLYMTGRWPAPGMDVVHINEIQKDDRWCNLREVPRSQNQLNRGLHPNNKTGVKGVGRMKSGNYRAIIGTKWLGTFKTLEAATAARQQAERELWAQH
jgi:hypothetical protein